MAQAPSSNGNGHHPPSVAVSALWERPVATPDGSATLLIRVVAPPDCRPGRRTPVDIAVVLDRSGSMNGEPLALAKQAVDAAAGHLRDEDRAALVVFDHEVDLLQPLGPATPRAKAALRLALHGIDAGGSTDLGGGWLAGCRELAEAGASPARSRRALLLTDGQANVGIVDPGALVRHAAELRTRGISTTTLGVGLGFNEALLQAMAEAGGGNYQFVERPEELRAFFEAELRELLGVVALGLSLEVGLPEGLRAVPVSAFPAERRGRTWTVAVGDVPAGEEIEIVFRLAVKGGQTGDELPATVIAAWTDPTADRRRTAAADLPALVLAPAMEVERAIPDGRVAEALAVQTAAAERKRALELDREGRTAESRRAMASARDVLAAAPMSDRVRFMVQDTQVLADSAGPYDEATRKRAAWEDERRRKNRRVERQTGEGPGPGPGS